MIILTLVVLEKKSYGLNPRDYGKEGSTYIEKEVCNIFGKLGRKVEARRESQDALPNCSKE
ncbi:hypothetical protein Lal_00007877 [Lupinus albus]|nr:hypothetical protein Lal_00007877 [Lupinus albus]